ncbi:hypothetical protein [Spirillospora sp. NPDC029432]|uniref:hypothetical protein n=1 Tax=Spirillospora sp. NPDC029432 TaxID=3154599 RepID=UPI0034548CDF
MTLAARRMAGRLTLPFERGGSWMRLALGADGTVEEHHGFDHHEERFGVPPDPAYVVEALADVKHDTTVRLTGQGREVSVTVPAGTPAGTSFAAPRTAGTVAQVTAEPSAGDVSRGWAVTALLGTIAKALWVVGWERDHLRRQFARVLSQRHLPFASGRALDALGTEFGVPRLAGEGDDRYRDRLGAFRAWTLPTAAGLAEVLNTAVGRLGEDGRTLVVDDSDGVVHRGVRTVRVVPARIPEGTGIDAAGRTTAAEGDAPPEGFFDARFLTRIEGDGADHVPPPPPPDDGDQAGSGGPPPDPRLVQPDTARAFGRLLPLAAAEAAGGRLRVLSAFDPAAPDGRATGRAMLMEHTAIGSARLAALAHRAGFDLVFHRRGGEVYAATLPGELFVLAAAGADQSGDVLPVGGALVLALRPAPPAGAAVRYRTVPCGPGSCTLAPAPDGASVTVTGTAPGRVTVKAEISYATHTLTATRELTARPASLETGTTIAADGTTDPGDLPAGGDAGPAFLVRHDDERVDYGGAEDNRRMHRTARDRLDDLLGRIAALGTVPPGRRLRILAAYRPDAPGPAGQGRELRLAHPDVPPGRLAALAHAAGFDRARADAESVTVRQAPADPVDIAAPASWDGVLEMDAETVFTVRPAPDTVGSAGVLGWSAGPAGHAGAGLVSARSETPATAVVRGLHPGTAWVQATYLMGDSLGPYRFAVRLHPPPAPDAKVITAAQFDLIVRLLGDLRPLGVEVVTRELRDHLIET